MSGCASTVVSEWANLQKENVLCFCKGEEKVAGSGPAGVARMGGAADHDERIMTKRQPLAARVWGSMNRTWFPPDAARHRKKAKRRSAKRERQKFREEKAGLMLDFTG
jgi:hypothetical protein